MKRHDLDVTSLVSGAIFLAVGIVFLVDLTSAYSLQPGALVALVLIGIGLGGLLSTVTSDKKSDVAGDTDSDSISAGD